MIGEDPEPTVLVVDDEPGLREVLSITLRRHGFKVEAVPGVKRAVAAIDERDEPFALVLTDLVMPDGSGMQVLEHARENSSHTQVIMITAYSTLESAIEAMRQGAYDFVTKPFSPAEIAELAKKAVEKSSIVAENRRLKATLGSIAPPEIPSPFGDEPAMRRVAVLVEKAASTRTTVLITGESGTGKEHSARLLHELSDRADGPFMVVNCGALPEQLMESELFGHEKGAFTGAAHASLGLFRQADGGTLMLDEVGELPLSLQVKLLRVLQERKVRPVGGSVEVDVDVRLVAATNRDVEAEVEAGRFRTDLYYRLNVIRIALPPLRERRGDIQRLTLRMLKRFADEFGKGVSRITPAAMRALEGYDFPGNIRELENMIERAVALTSTDEIDVVDLPEVVAGQNDGTLMQVPTLPAAGVDLDAILEQTERQLLSQALERSSGVRKNAAKLLGITFRSLRYRLQKLGMDVPGDDGPVSSNGRH